MKKGKKIIIIVLTIWLVFFTTDYMLYKFDKRPIFSIPIVVYKDGGTVEYYGPGYKIIKYNRLDEINGESGRKDMEFGLWNLKYSEKK